MEKCNKIQLEQSLLDIRQVKRLQIIICSSNRRIFRLDEPFVNLQDRSSNTYANKMLY
jgi:hypothetical protein